MALPFSDEQLIEMAKEWGARDAGRSDGLEGMEPEDLEDVADDAWYHSGWMEFENHPKLDGHESEVSEKSASLRLGSHYKQAFVAHLTGE